MQRFYHKSLCGNMSSNNIFFRIMIEYDNINSLIKIYSRHIFICYTLTGLIWLSPSRSNILIIILQVSGLKFELASFFKACINSLKSNFPEWSGFTKQRSHLLRSHLESGVMTCHLGEIGSDIRFGRNDTRFGVLPQKMWPLFCGPWEWLVSAIRNHW